MLMAERGDEVEIPRQACVLPGDYAQFGNWDNVRQPEVWMKTLEEWVASGYKAGKGFWKRRLRLFLVCAHTHQLVPCGHNGRGYKVQRYRKWARVTFDVAKFVLQATCATLAAMVVGQLPSTTSGVGEQLVDAAVSRLQARLEASVSDDRDGQVQALKGNAYRHLQTLLHEIEETARLKISAAIKKARRGGKALPIASEFVFFEQVMAKVQARTGVGEAQWVLKEHEDAHYDAVR